MAYVRRPSVSFFLIALATVIVAIPPVGRAQSTQVRRDPARVARAHRILEARAQGLNYVPGEVLVRFRSAVDGFQNAQALSVLGSDNVRSSSYRWIGDVLHMTTLNGVDVPRAVEDLAAQPEVAWAQPNYINRKLSTPNEPNFSRQWNMTAINMPAAWDINPGAANGVVVAVLDTGITTTEGTFDFRLWNGITLRPFDVPMARAADFNHARIRTPVDLEPFGGWQANDGSPMHFDSDGHGTHVAATIAQETNNGLGFAGAAFGVELMPIKVCYSDWDVQMAFNADGFPGFVPIGSDGCDSASITEGIRYAADNGAQVINMSFGGDDPQPAWLEAIRYAVARGVFVAMAAGNEALEGNAPSYPAAYATQVIGAVSVAAVTPTLQRAIYSNTGSYIELAAPGGAGSSGALAEQVLQIAPNQSDLNIFRLSPAFNRYQELGISGTSMASPHVAAVAALLRSQGVGSPAAIEAVLKATARDLGPAGRDDQFGFGMVDARAAIRGLGVTK